MTLAELKAKALESKKHIAASSSDVAWGLSFEEMKTLDIQSARFAKAIARYEKSGSEETLSLMRHMVASAIVAA